MRVAGKLHGQWFYNFYKSKGVQRDLLKCNYQAFRLEAENNRWWGLSLQVPALKHCKWLSVLPQDRLLNSDVVKLYLALLSSLISKPDLFSAYRDPIFYCEHNRGGEHAEGMAQPSTWAQGRCSLTMVEKVPKSYPCWVGLGSKPQGNYQFEKWGLFPSWDFSPCFLFLLALALVLSRKEACCFMFIFCPPPASMAVLWGPHSNFPLQTTWQHATWVDSNLWISFPETLRCHGAPQLIS